MAMLSAVFAGVRAQEKVEISADPDQVSSYVWRGVYRTGMSIQPLLGVQWKGISLRAWGSTDFDLSLAVTDY